MAVTTYATVRNNVQSVIYDILSSDSGVVALCNHILDGSLYKIAEERGFPYIIVNTPTTFHNNRVLDNSNFTQDINVGIVVASIKESVVRQLADAVINALKTNQSTTRTAKLNWFRLLNTNLRPFKMDNGDTVHLYEINVGYKFIG
jgi:sensor c-di-GMP phosphodiesterase-like protein